jgi:hypothetical protein
MTMFKQTVIAAAIAAIPLSVCNANSGPDLTPVPSANPKVPGIVAPTTLSPELMQVVRAAGANPVENPTAGIITHYGYANAGTNVGTSTVLKPMIPLTANVEAQKTEPDKNTYLVLDEQSGPDATYDYGKHFVFQGHELGVDDGTGTHQMGAITRINLDADAAHRITVLATTDADGKSLPVIDGSTWYPFSEHLLFSQEGNGTSTGGVWQATVDFPSTVESVQGIGRGGFEGIQGDRDGNLWVVEDIGGVKSPSGSNAKIPNSFVYRFVPYNRHNLLAGGKLFALQVMSKANPGQPINFQTAIQTGTALTPDMQDLHTYNNVFDTKWVLIHDTAAANGKMPFNANQLAKDANATPFKRPENGQFRPGSDFREFFFDETGDTDATSTANASYGGWGAVLKLTQAGPSAMTGKLSPLFIGDQVHTGFDNVGFWDASHVVFVEDAGDLLHGQRNAFDSAWMLDVRADYSKSSTQPVRIIAQGRDASATIDSAFSPPGNEGDNEITGIHISDGDPGVWGLLGARIPDAFDDGWRVFYTGQHGENYTYEILPNNGSGRH